MRRIGILLLVLAVFSGSVWAADRKATLEDGTVVILHDNGTWSYAPAAASMETAGAFDFRKVRWGMRQAEVIQSEPGEFVVQEHSLVYEVDLLGLNALLLYNFAGERLEGAGYLLNGTLSGVAVEEKLFLRLQGLLTEKYGPMQELPAAYAFFKPKYSFTGYWETERSRILLVGGESQIGIFYESKGSEAGEERNDLRDL